MGYSLPNVRRHRDITILDLNEKQTLVIACDSAGAIGPKEGDIIHVTGHILGRFTARVALMEVLAVGAWPVCVVNTLCVEPVPTGEDIRTGVAEELKALGIDPELVLTGSNEKNIPTSQSGIGVTVVGLVERSKLRVGQINVDDSIAVFGLPKVGAEVRLDDPQTVDLLTVQQLLNDPDIKEIVPVGSQGIKEEVIGLRDAYQLNFMWENNLAHLDVNKSAGPATCLLAIANTTTLESISKNIKKPFLILGRFTS